MGKDSCEFKWKQGSCITLGGGGALLLLGLVVVEGPTMDVKGCSHERWKTKGG